MIDVSFEVPLPPIGKGRPRMTKTGHAYTPTKTRSWESQLALMAAEHMPTTVIEEPIAVDILAIMARPQRLLRKSDPDGLIWAPTRPDGDNIRKGVLDSLKSFWRDDAQVVDGATLKAYAERDGRARTVVRVRSAGEIDDAVERLFGGVVRRGPCVLCGGPLSITHYRVRAGYVCGDCAGKAVA